MKKFLLCFVILITSLSSNATEEVFLDTVGIDSEQKNNLNFQSYAGLKLYAEYFNNVYYGKTEDNEKVSPVLKLFSKDGIIFENSFVNSVKAGMIFSDHLDYTLTQGGKKTFTHSLNTIEPQIKVKFNENKSEAVISYNITRFIKPYDNDFSEKFSSLYIAHNINKNQKIMIGQGPRLPSTYDGSVGVYGLETVNRGLIGRNLGNVMSTGVRNIADYKYMEYDIGLYDSTRYMHDFGNGTDFTGFVMFKPFGINNESKTNFKLGASYNIGKNDISYNMYSFRAMYDYKKLHVHGEYANADGYNSIVISPNKADGMNIFVSYDITPKLSLSGKYDTFTPDKNFSNKYITEYTAGLTYIPYKNLKFILNYVRQANSSGTDSDMILFATRFNI